MNSIAISFSLAAQCCVALVLLFPAAALPAGEAVELSAPQPAEPLPGKLVICGGGPIPEGVYQQFVDWAGGPHARLVVIPTASEYADSIDMHSRVHAQFAAFGVTHVQLLHTRSIDAANDEKFVACLKDATGVWIGGGVQARLTEAYLGTAVEKALHGVLARGGVVGGTSSGAAVMSRLMIREGKTVAQLGQGFGFVTNAVIDQHFLKRNRQERLMGVLDNNPGLFGLGIDESTAVLIEGRRMRVMGVSKACVCFAGCSQRPARVDLLGEGEQADLVALSRAAIARTRSVVAAVEEQPPQVAAGTLVIAGGGTLPSEVVERFIGSAGGDEAPLVVVTTAQGETPPPEQEAIGWLKKAGAKNVKQVHARTRSEADQPQILAALEAAKGVWFMGGRQWRLVDAFANTKAYQLFASVLEEGGVVGGSSAGATIQGGYLVRGNPLGNDDMICEGYEEGFRFLPGVAIDQHFTQRNRVSDMLKLKRTYPSLLGLGIDESTAVIVHGHQMEVVGKHQVAVFDRAVDSAESERPYEALAPGDRYDFVSRQRLDRSAAEGLAAPRKEVRMPATGGQ